MKRRTFLKCSGMAAGMAHQPATQQVLEPESSFDLIDSKESELSELVCTKTSLWGLARHVGEKSSFRLARRPIPQGPVRGTVAYGIPYESCSLGIPVRRNGLARAFGRRVGIQNRRGRRRHTPRTPGSKTRRIAPVERECLLGRQIHWRLLGRHDTNRRRSDRRNPDGPTSVSRRIVGWILSTRFIGVGASGRAGQGAARRPIPRPHRHDGRRLRNRQSTGGRRRRVDSIVPWKGQGST